MKNKREGIVDTAHIVLTPVPANYTVRKRPKTLFFSSNAAYKDKLGIPSFPSSYGRHEETQPDEYYPVAASSDFIKQQRVIAGKIIAH